MRHLTAFTGPTNQLAKGYLPKVKTSCFPFLSLSFSFSSVSLSLTACVLPCGPSKKFRHCSYATAYVGEKNSLIIGTLWCHHTHTHTHGHTCTYAHACTHTHTCTHTHAGNVPPYQLFTNNLLACARVHQICDGIWENPPYGINAQFAQCVFLVHQVQNCQSPDFVISMSNNPSSVTVA